MANFELSIPVQCVPIWIYYGMKTVGKLFFLWGAVFFLVSFGVMEQEVDPEKKSFWMIFVASSAAMAFMRNTMFFARLRMVRIPSGSCWASPGLPPWMMVQ